MANYNFNKDIIIGEQGEDTVVHKLTTFYKDTIAQPKDYNPKQLNIKEYDRIITSLRTGKDYYIEIKTDVYCTPDYDTGNMFIEFEWNHKPSGIRTTKSDLFITYFKHLKELWIIPTEKLKDLIFLLITLNEHIRTTMFSGDILSHTKGYLIKREQCRDYFTVLPME